ncbi:MAG: isochorismatase family protein [Pirellulales bacterium]|nr:isochorismatase family protein [Pirellulales bacterium]
MRPSSPFPPCCSALILCLALATLAAAQDQPPGQRQYANKLVRIAAPKPILADHPEWVQPVQDLVHYEAPPLVIDDDADLDVRAWRWSYNARGIIEIPNRLRAKDTAIVVVHPWGIDDGQGWRTPQPAGVADFCTPEKNALSHEHVLRVVNPFLESLRPRVAMVLHSEPGSEDPIRKKLYRSIRGRPTPEDRAQGREELAAKLHGFAYTGGALPETITVSKEFPVIDYFRSFPGLDAGPHYNNSGFWDLPIPVLKSLSFTPDDVVVYDAEGYDAMRDFLKQSGIRHILLAGYCTDMCFKATTAGYANLRKDFNVFLVGDATLATFPANSMPAYATNAAISFAALENLVTQISWVKPRGK